jgi:hypothetical protein
MSGTTASDQGQCPICNKVFDLRQLECHAASCGEEDERAEEKSVWPMLQQDVIEINDKDTPKKKKRLRPPKKDIEPISVGEHLYK